MNTIENQNQKPIEANPSELGVLIVFCILELLEINLLDEVCSMIQFYKKTSRDAYKLFILAPPIELVVKLKKLPALWQPSVFNMLFYR